MSFFIFCCFTDALVVSATFHGASYDSRCNSGDHEW
uniref:Uncharacterized protein n=1 Tax=Rhizophora mucronata TaxID=61149 RepID=A0A2P2QQR8_RHIMU